MEDGRGSARMEPRHREPVSPRTHPHQIGTYTGAALHDLALDIAFAGHLALV
jgi:hypothetical protein